MPKRVIALVQWGIRLDPSTGILCLIAWCLLNSLTYFGPGQAFPASHVYDVLASCGVNEDYLGLAQLSDAVLLAICLAWSNEPFRVFVALVTMLLWSLFGAGMLIGAWRIGLFSAVGGFSLSCGFLAGLSMTQWAMQEVDA